MKNIFSNTSPVISTGLLTTESLDIDILVSMLENLNRMENESFNISKNHLYARYCSMQENSIEILQEGFGDFINSCTKFFKSLLDKVIKFFDGVMMYIRAYVGDFDKFLIKYKEAILKKRPDFTISGYNYSFRSDIPTMSIIEHVVSDYNSELVEVGSNLNKGFIVDLRNKYGSEEFFDGIRGKCLGKSNKIQQDKFIEELRKEFRSDKDSEMDIHVNDVTLRSYMEDYGKLKTSLTDLNKMRSSITSMLNEISSFFQGGVHVYYKEDKKVIGMDQLNKNDYSISTGERKTVEYKSEHLDLYASFYDYKFKQAKELSHVAILAMTAKVDALKEALQFYRTVIRKSM